MFFRRSIVKQLIAAFGIALTVLGGLQQSHLLCRAMGCQPLAAASGQATCCQAAKATSCKHACDTVNARPTCIRVAIASTCKSSNSAPSCPLPGQCVCCESTPAPNPAPPVSADELTVAVHFECVNAATAFGSFSTQGFKPSLADFCTERSIETCIRLCRFLA